jgi:hypothetical protein
MRASRRAAGGRVKSGSSGNDPDHIKTLFGNSYRQIRLAWRKLDQQQGRTERPDGNEVVMKSMNDDE